MAHPKVIVNLYPVLPARDDAVGAVRRVSVVPAPYQPPHPPVFTAVSASMESIEFCAERAIAPVYFSSMISIVNMAQHYVTDGRVQGRDCQLGEPQCTVRWPHFTRDLADTGRARRGILQKYLWHEWHLLKPRHCELTHRPRGSEI